MLSRVAEKIYWMARYAERAENIARIINVNSHLMLDLPKQITPGWKPLIDITGGSQTFFELFQETNERNAIKYLTSEKKNPGSLINSLIYARENARTIRGVIPREAWEQLNNLYHTTQTHLPQALPRRNRFDFLASIIGGVQQLTGLLAGTMTHNFGYYFLRMGRNLERADMTTRIVDVMSENLLSSDPDELSPYKNIQWMSILKSLSADQSYRQYMQSSIHRSSVLKFLLQNTDFPRAFLHCVGEIQNSLQQLPRHLAPLRATNNLMKKIGTADLHQLEHNELHLFLDDLQLDIIKLHEVLAATYFALDTPQSPAKRRKITKGKPMSLRSKTATTAEPANYANI